MLIAAVKRILRTPIPPSGVRFKKPWRPCWGFSFGMQMSAELKNSILARLRTENEMARQELGARSRPNRREPPAFVLVILGITAIAAFVFLAIVEMARIALQEMQRRLSESDRATRYPTED
jgi:hypothetical protein